MENQEYLNSFYAKVYELSNKLTQRFIIVLSIVGLAVSAIHQTWLTGIIYTISTLLIYFVSRQLMSAAALRYMSSFLYGNISLQFILELQGSYASFFVYFFCFVLLLLFENWRVLMPLAVHAVVTFIIIFVLSVKGPIAILPNLPSLNIVDIVTHLLFISAFIGICIYWSSLQRNQTISSAEQEHTANLQLNATEANMQFAGQLSSGNLNTEYPATHIDALGQSLLTMRKSLVLSNEREDREKFHTTGLAEVGELLRKFSNNLEELSDRIIEKLVKYMKANQGSLFVMDEAEGNLKLLAARAWERKKFIQKTVAIGEGLVGQAVLEKETIYMTSVPEDYIIITSGLGSASPRSVVIVPLKNEEQVIGVIELASFQKFSDYEISFLEKVGESIASTIITARNNQRTKELLDSSKEQEEQLRAQEEEMRQNMEEMQATQEEMSRAQNEITAKRSELEQRQATMEALINSTDDSILLMDRNYKVILMNQVLRNRYKGTQYESLDVGSDSLSALGTVRDEWKGYYDRVLAGETLNFSIKSSVKGENTYREYFINPVKSGGSIYGLSVFSRDVTKHYKAVDEMTKKSALLDGIINHNSDTYFAIDLDYKILIVNDVLRNRFLASKIELKPGISILDNLPKETLAIWKERYDKALKGEKLRFQEERKVGDKVLFLEVLVDPIYSGDTIIGCSTVSKDITEIKAMQNKLASIELK